VLCEVMHECLPPYPAAPATAEAHHPGRYSYFVR
jgi:hypothetical protein